MSLAMTEAEQRKFAAELGPIMTPEQLKKHTEQINSMNGVDFKKINEQMKEQIEKENKVFKGYLLNSITDIENLIKEKEDKIQFFEYKIKNLDKNDDRLIQYEKEIFFIEKEIQGYKDSIEQIKKDVKNLQ